MAAEVETVQRKVSPKGEVEVVDEERHELGASADQDLPNRTNQNGDSKDDSDGSYVFVTENDAETDDPVEGTDDVGVSAGKEVVKEEGKSGVHEERKTDNVVGDSFVENVVIESQAIADPEAKKEDDEVMIEEDTRHSEGELPQGGDGKVENTEVSESKSAEMRKESQDSQTVTESPPDSETSELASVEEKGDSETVVAVDAQQNADPGKQPVTSDQGRESVESVSHEIPQEGPPGDAGQNLEPNLPKNLGQAADVHLESEAVKMENSDVQVESEAVTVLASAENGDAPLESESVTDPTSDEIGDVPFQSEAVSVPAFGENSNAQLESEAVRVLIGGESGSVQLESEVVSIPASDETGNVHLESEAVTVTADDENGNIRFESEPVEVSASIERGDLHLGSETVDFPGSDENAGDLVGADQKTPDQNGCSGHAEDSSSGQCETVSIENDESFTVSDVNNTRSILTDDPADKGLTEDIESEMKQNLKEETAVLTEPEVSCDTGDVCTIGHDQGTIADTNTASDADAGQDIDEESKSLTPVGACEDLTVESGRTGSDIETDVLKVTENFASSTSDVKKESEVVHSNVKHRESIDSLTVDDSEVDIEVKDGSIENHRKSSSPAVSCENRTTENSAVGAEDDNRTESESAQLDPKSSQTATESEFLNGSSIESEEKCTIPDSVNVVGSKVQSNEVDKDDNIACHEKENVDGSQNDENPASPGEVSLVDASEGNNVATEIEKKPFYYLIRVPRYDDENLKDQIRHAQLQVDKKTEIRDAIKAEIQKIRASHESGDSLKAALGEEKSARDLLRAKRQEIDSLQSKINVVKSVTSVEDIDGRVRSMEHMIEHETLPLKEEKQLIREIKQLKQLREQISSNMGTQDEVQQALDQKDETEERLKVLRKEAALLRDNVLKAETVTKAAREKRDNKSDKLSQLIGQFKAADAVRQEAFAYLQTLRKQSYEKNKYFYNYRDEAKAANDLALKGDKEALQSLCINQVETFMNLWNKDDEFRKDYIRCNIRSTLRRFKTLDGRSLGPDEKPPVVPRAGNERLEKPDTVSSVPTPELGKRERVLPVEEPKVESNSPMTKSGEQKNQPAESKRPVKPTPPASASVTVSGMEEAEEVKVQEPKRTKEEEELARKAEELREQKDAERLREQRRLEEIAKAKEALERKKRNAEKAKARAALRAQKEAEEKEKEREKRLRKKEKQKATSTTADDTNVTNEEQIVPSSETHTEPQKDAETVTQEKPATPTKKPHKPSQFIKQSKLKSIPPPLRNRGKRKIQQWMWVTAIALFVFALFLLGNSEFSLKPGLLRAFGF